MKRIICFVLCIVMTVAFAACGKDKKDNEKPVQEETSDVQPAETYSPEWVVSPSIKAARIWSLPLTDFNEASSHYDVSFGEIYAFESDGKIGFIDSNGQVIIEPKYETAQTCTCTDKYIVTTKSESGYTTNYRFSSSNLTPVWAKAHTCEGTNGYRYIWNSASGKISLLYYTNGKSIASVKKAYAPEAAEITENGTGTGKFTVVTAGAAVGEADYTAAGIFTDGIVAVEKGGKWGYVNSKGEQVIPFEYDAIKGYSALHETDKDTPYESSEGFVTVCKDGKYGILKSDGTEVVPCRFNSLTTVHNGRAFASENGTDWGILCVDKKISEGIAPSRSTEKTTAATSRKSTSKYSASSSVSSRSSQKSKSSSSKSSVSTSSGSKNQKTSNSSRNSSSNKSTTSRKVNG